MPISTDDTDNTDIKKHEPLYADLTFKINGVLFSAHNELGQYARERQYGEVVDRLFQEKNIPYKKEVVIGDSGNIVDGIVDGKVLLEFKAKRIVTKDDYYQTQRYLQETGLLLGILVNFRDKYIKPKRIVKITSWRQ